MSRRLLLFLLTSAVAFLLGFWTFTPVQALKVVRWGGYWLMLGTTFAFAAALVRSLSDVGPEVRAWRNWWLGALVPVLAAGFLHLHEPHEFKIVADEVVLQMTAKQMHYEREAAVVLRGYEHAGNFTALITSVDKRPLFFPFLLSMVHGLTGFRTANAFLLNAALSLVLMALLSLIGRRIGGWGGGVSLVLLFSTIPLVAQNACGGGFELLNLVMIALTIWLGLRASENPDDGDRLGAFVLSGVLLAQVRYESILFIGPVCASVAYLWWRQRALRLPFWLLVAPLLLVPAPLAMNAFALSTEAWQLSDVAGSAVPFSPSYFYDNVGHALNFFLSANGFHGNSLLVTFVGALGVGFFVLTLYREHRGMFCERPAEAVLSIFIIGLLVHTSVMLCYFWGRWDDPIIRRLSLPAHLLLSLSIVFVWPRLFTHWQRWRILSAAALIYLVALTIPHNAQHRYTQEIFAARATNWIGDHVRALGGQSVLAVDRFWGLQWPLYDKSNITVDSVAFRPDGFVQLFRNRSFQHFLVVQRLTPDPRSGQRKIEMKDDLGDGVELELIEERDFAPSYHVRLSRIVSIDEEKLNAWAQRYIGMRPLPRAGLTQTAAQLADEQILGWLRQKP